MILKLRGVELEPLGSVADICMRRIIDMERRERVSVIQMLGQGLAGQFPPDGKVFPALKSMMSEAMSAVYGEEAAEQNKVDEDMLAEFNRLKEFNWRLKAGNNGGKSYNLEVNKRGQ